jgi:hypothetical protein
MWLAAVAAERAFTAQLVGELDRGDLTWDVEQLGVLPREVVDAADGWASVE